MKLGSYFTEPEATILTAGSILRDTSAMWKLFEQEGRAQVYYELENLKTPTQTSQPHIVSPKPYNPQMPNPLNTESPSP